MREKIPMLIGTAALLVGLAVVGWRQANPAWSVYQDDPQVRLITPNLTNEPELCLTCHFGVEEVSESHPVEAFGCTSCHGGNPLSLDEDTVHDTLIDAASLSTVEATCGGSDCHSGSPEEGRDHIARATRGLHTTYASAVNPLLQVAGIPTEGFAYGMRAVSDDDVQDEAAVAVLLGVDQVESEMVTRFREECASCHIGAASTIAEPYYYRSTSCAACHMLTTRSGLYQGEDPTLPRDEPGHVAVHRLTTAIPYSTCNACHNRGTHDLETLTFTPRTDLGDVDGLAPSERRLRELYLPGDTSHYAPCQTSLDCIDCHTVNEVMGSGDIYTHADDTQPIECRTCHGTLEEPPVSLTLEDPNGIAFRLAQLNPFYDVFTGNTVVLAPDGLPLGHIRVEGDIVSLTGKTTGTPVLIPQVPGSSCEQNVDEQAAEDCQECHTDE